ncbi:MAG: HAD-IB family hydrolase [Acidimicrobiia bacterium]|nr:HAD-IB family hydrolase [Acidimicrobiia bacterium]MDH5293931.1 HAD-IB family hydrolase [Acidimicrobiia bacterium]
MSGAAFFDLDRTLISGVSVFPFAAEAWRQGLATNKQIAAWALDAAVFALLGETPERKEEARNAVLGGIAGVAVEMLEGVADAVVPKLAQAVRPESLRLLDVHREAGRDTWIASASPHRIVERLALELGMTGGIGTRAKIVEGHFTDEIDGPFVHGPGKAEAVRSVIIEQGYDPLLCYAYSDSISDLPLLDAVGHPVAVNPDSALEAIARDRGWPIVVFARKTKLTMAWSAGGVSVAALSTGTYLLGRRHGRRGVLSE